MSDLVTSATGIDYRGGREAAGSLLHTRVETRL
jgi:hypothetical protein